MATQPLPSPEELRQLLRYEPEIGKLFWKERGPHQIPCPRLRNAWNSRCAGKMAGGSTKYSKYDRLGIHGVMYPYHRVVWAIFHGEWPNKDIDHINGVRNDNRIANLRQVSRKENLRNQVINPRNTSGAVGVRLCEFTGRWHARITNKHIGRYDTFEEAVTARKAAEKAMGFHPNHGLSAIQRSQAPL